MRPPLASGRENLLPNQIGDVQCLCVVVPTGTALYSHSSAFSPSPQCMGSVYGQCVIHRTAEPLVVPFEVTIGEPEPNPNCSVLVAATDRLGMPFLTPYLK